MRLLTGRALAAVVLVGGVALVAASRSWADRPKVEFVQVEQKTAADPSSFYLMKNKVWRSLFAEFAHKHPEKVSGQWTVEPGQEKLIRVDGAPLQRGSERGVGDAQ